MNNNQEPESLSKAIYLIGPQSTGKTTLLNGLIKCYSDFGQDTTPPPHLSEIARKVLMDKRYVAADLNGPKCLQMQMDIFTAHFQAEMNLFAGGQFAFISDRSAIDPIMYTRQYCTQAGGWRALYDTPMWRLLGNWYRDQKSTVAVLLEPINTFLLPDGVRKMPENWSEMEALAVLFKEFLEEERIPFYTLGKECMALEERVTKVVDWAKSQGGEGH